MEATSPAATTLVGQVRSTCEAVCAQAKHVSIDTGAKLDAAANQLVDTLEANQSPPAWDEYGWHYCADARENGPLTCAYVFVLDSLNFCFWPSPGLEYEQMAVGLRDVLVNDPDAFLPSRLMAVNADTLKTWLPSGNPAWVWPQIEERVERIQDLGRVLNRFVDTTADPSGRCAAASFVAQAHGSAAELTRLVVDSLVGFRDTAIYAGRVVHLYKRAQILVADLWAAYGCRTEGPYGFRDIAALTTFADYRVPQLLRNMGVMTYDTALSAKVDAREEIAPGSEEEVEVRAATVVAVERLRRRVTELGKERGVVAATGVTAVHVDWFLWQQGEAMVMDGRLDDCPHHRTLTVYY
jgi:hypothetical protein